MMVCVFKPDASLPWDMKGEQRTLNTYLSDHLAKIYLC